MARPRSDPCYNPGMDLRTVGVLLVGLLLWASAFAGIREGLTDFSPGALILFRFLVASAVFGLYALATGMRLPARRDLPGLFGLGLLGVTVYHVGLTFGEVTVTAGAASLLIASNPIFTALLSAGVLGERLRRWGWIGICLSFGGAALVALGEGGGLRFDPRAFLVLMAAISSSFYFVFQKKFLLIYGPVSFAAYAIWLGTIPTLVFLPRLLSELPDASSGGIASLVYLGVFPSAVAYVLWTYAFSRAPAPLVASFLYLVPVLAIVIAYVWLGEVPVALSLVGGFLALFGVILVNTWGRPVASTATGKPPGVSGRPVDAPGSAETPTTADLGAR
jgi:drug/metabolite transporter (DMT)-like permease